MARKFRKRPPKEKTERAEDELVESEPEESGQRPQGKKRRRSSAPKNKGPSPKTLYFMGAVGLTVFALAWTAIAAFNTEAGGTFILPSGILALAGTMLLKWISAEKENASSRVLLSFLWLGGSAFALGLILDLGAKSANPVKSERPYEKKGPSRYKQMVDGVVEGKTASQWLQALREIQYPGQSQQEAVITRICKNISGTVEANADGGRTKIFEEILQVAVSAPHPKVRATLLSEAIRISDNEEQGLDRILAVYEEHLQLKISDQETLFPFVTASEALLAKTKKQGIQNRILTSLFKIIAANQASEESAFNRKTEEDILLKNEWLPALLAIFPKLNTKKQKRTLCLVEQLDAEARLPILRLIAKLPEHEEHILIILRKLPRASSSKEECLALAMSSPSVKVRTTVLDIIVRLQGFPSYRRMLKTMAESDPDPRLKEKASKALKTARR